MTTMTRLTLLFAAIACTTTLTAQDATWPELKPDAHVLIVPTAQPGHRLNCDIASADDRSISCSRLFGRKPRVVAKESIAALIAPGMHTPPLGVLPYWGAAQAGLIAGAVVLASISTGSAVALAVVGTFIVFAFSYAVGLSMDGEYPDKLLYLKAGEKLTVPLRWQK